MQFWECQNQQCNDNILNASGQPMQPHQRENSEVLPAVLIHINKPVLIFFISTGRRPLQLWVSSSNSKLSGNNTLCVTAETAPKIYTVAGEPTLPNYCKDQK